MLITSYTPLPHINQTVLTKIHDKVRLTMGDFTKKSNLVLRGNVVNCHSTSVYCVHCCNQTFCLCVCHSLSLSVFLSLSHFLCLPVIFKNIFFYHCMNKDLYNTKSITNTALNQQRGRRMQGCTKCLYTRILITILNKNS